MQPRDFIQAYSLTLNQQKQIIKTNTYARELELKYHKKRHQNYKKPKISTSPQGEKPQWPIESTVFTQVLKSKLQSIPVLDPSFTTYNKKFMKQIRDNLNHRIQSEEIELPRLDKSRLWSPPKLNTYKFKNFDLNPKEFGPKVKQIQYSTKTIY
jgi:hypothetical protein